MPKESTIASKKSREALLRKIIVTSLDDDKAEDIVVVDLGGKSSFADAMVIASGRSQRHVGAIADHVAQKVREAGFEHVRIEGKELCDWVLIDAGDIIVHVFRPEVREIYNLEKMWSLPTPKPVQPTAFA
ncbi:MAG: ribosome silencing factor [Rickettsiales bacterium]